MAKCDLLFVKVWNTTCGSAIQMRNNAGCDSDSPITEIELLVGRDLEAFGDSLAWPNIRSMPLLKQIEDPAASLRVVASSARVFVFLLRRV